MKTTFNWKSKTGHNIYGVHWGGQAPKAVICLVHGHGEHCERYAHLAKYFNDRNFAVVAYDHIGHGHSEGKRGHTPNIDAYLDDIALLLGHARQFYPDAPLVLYGHSMGGNLVLNFTLRRKPDIRATIATGPWIQLAFEPNKALVTVGKLLRGIAPSLQQPTGLDPAHISKQAQVVEAYKNDPLVHGKTTPAAGLGMMEAAAWLNNFKEEVPVPLLVMHGADDKITDPEGTKNFARNAKGDVTLKLWDGLYHEIHNEANQNEIFDFTINWLESRL
jgi:alpha-beta hydrolase superfamily lysophospholipase